MALILKIFKDKYIKNASLITLAVFLVASGVSYFSLRDVEHLLIIHFTNLGWIDFLGTKNHVYGILFSGLIVALLNLFLAHIFYERARFFSYFLSLFNIFFMSLILIGIGVIISVN